MDTNRDSATESRLKSLISQTIGPDQPENNLFEFFRLKQIRDICEKLELKTTGKRKDLCKLLKSYLITSEGLSHAYQCLGKETLKKLFDDIDPISTYIANYQDSNQNPSVLSSLTACESMRNDKKKEIRCVCLKGTMPYIKCNGCNFYQHWNCMGRNTMMEDYECPFCQSVNWDPLQEILDVLVMPFALSREDPKVCLRRLIKNFEVTEEILRKIHEDGGRFEIQLRCLKFDGKGYNNDWPNAGAVVINDALIMETHRILDVHHLPLNISGKILFGTNSLSVIKYNDTQYYAACVYFVQKLTFYELYSKIKENQQVLDEEEGKKVLISLLAGKNCNIPIKCCLSNRPMQEPVRGVKCKHIRCFDLIRWLQLQSNPKIARWICPICKQRTVKVLKDEYMEKALIMAQIVGNIESIDFAPDGEYSFCSIFIKKTAKKSDFCRAKHGETIILD